jgi:LPXTG-site transpeptidase (sortase) family protein
MNISHFFDQLYREIKLRKVPFFVVFFIIVFVTYSILFAIDFIPEPVTSVSSEEDTEEMEETNTIADNGEVTPFISEQNVSALPKKIIFDSLDKEITILNPESRSIADLDTALLSGVVRHPDSADFNTVGNILIVGHSSYLPTVFNKNFQAFNGIQNLVWGDTVRLQSDDTEYIYRVQKVYEAKSSAVFVPSTPGKAQLTLSTCNSFGSKDDRFIVEATLVDSRAL